MTVFGPIIRSDGAPWPILVGDNDHIPSPSLSSMDLLAKTGPDPIHHLVIIVERDSARSWRKKVHAFITNLDEDFDLEVLRQKIEAMAKVEWDVIHRKNPDTHDTRYWEQALIWSDLEGHEQEELQRKADEKGHLRAYIYGHWFMAASRMPVPLDVT